LSYDENQEIQLFEWCGTAIESANSLDRELGLLRDKYKEQQKIISDLKNQLEDLITGKAAHETELLQKFCLLLNEKKSKIRDQQRLLASAKVDPSKLREIKAARSSLKPGKAEESRPRKRKSEFEQEASADENEINIGFDNMDVDIGQVTQDSDEEAEMTPEEDEETVDDLDNPYLQPEGLTRTRRRIGDDKGVGAVKGKSRAVKSATDRTAPASFGKMQGRQEKSKTPPFRQLPFPRKQAATGPVPAIEPPTIGEHESSETASEDDEL
jgi:hypothetical protein